MAIQERKPNIFINAVHVMFSSFSIVVGAILLILFVLFITIGGYIGIWGIVI